MEKPDMNNMILSNPPCHVDCDRCKYVWLRQPCGYSWVSWQKIHHLQATHKLNYYQQTEKVGIDLPNIITNPIQFLGQSQYSKLCR